MTYEDWITFAENKGLQVIELPLTYSVGMIVGDVIGIDSGLTSNQKAEVMSEELGHHCLTVGNILNQDDVRNRRQEHKARRWGYNRQVTQEQLLEAAKYGCRNAFEVAEFLGVTEGYLEDAIEDFKKQYGTAFYSDDFIIQYEPFFAVYYIEEDAQ